jgi:DHA2 family multidrug resistance protein-like MFS transporter
MPAGIPAEAAAVARDTLGGAMGVAAQLPGELGAALVDAAREAFVQGMQLTVALSAVVAAGGAVMATVLLRAVPAGAEAEAAEQPAPEPVAVAQPEPERAIQVIRVGSGCLACPGERQPSDVQRA